jgi:anti-sigma B factor antagonist
MSDKSGPVISGELHVVVSEVPPWTIISCDGDLDVTTSAQLRTAIRDTSGELGVIVDLERVAFVDSTALGVLIAGKKRVARGGRAFCIVVTSPIVLRIIAVTGLDDMFEVFGSLADAVASGTPPH